MAIQNKADQLKYKGRGPLDAKSLVKTYADLLKVDTWILDDALVAYNGMIVAVWLNKDDTTKNGIYYFFDPAVTSALTAKNADVTNPSNWHKISDKVDLSSIEAQIDGIEESIEELDSRIDALEVEYVKICGGSAQG